MSISLLSSICLAEISTRKDSDESTETVSDEGIDDVDSDSAAAASRDYLVSSVSKADLDLISAFSDLSTHRTSPSVY